MLKNIIFEKLVYFKINQFRQTIEILKKEKLMYGSIALEEKYLYL